MSDLNALIERLEKTEAGSRELDCYIWVAVNGRGQPIKRVGPPTYDSERFFCNPSPDIEWIGYDLLINAPAYTTSIDAALTLVPDGHPWRIDWVDDEDADVWTEEQPSYWINRHNGKGATPALSLCIAALRARESRHD